MSRLPALLVFFPGAALADPGHLADVAGHSHWVAGAAVAIALGLAAWVGLAGRKDKDAADEPEGDEAEA